MNETSDAIEEGGKRRQVVVIVDTTELFNDWQLQSKAWNTMLGLLGPGPIDLLVPRVVIRETARHYRREATRLDRTAISDLADALKQLTRVTSVPRLDIRAIREELLAQRNGYEVQLEQRLSSAGAIIADVPDIYPGTLLDWAIAERKPFKPAGDGFRDALVWLTVLDECERLTDTDLIVFASQNTTDFCDKDGDLAQDLARDVSEIESPPTVVIAHTLADSFHHFQPQIAEVRANQEALQQLESDHPFAVAVEDLLAPPILEACEGLTGQLLSSQAGKGIELEPLLGGAAVAFDVALPPGFTDATVYDLLPFPESLIWESYDRVGDQLLGTATVRCSLILSGAAPENELQVRGTPWEQNVLDVEAADQTTDEEPYAYIELEYRVDIVYAAAVTQAGLVSSLELQSVRSIGF